MSQNGMSPDPFDLSKIAKISGNKQGEPNKKGNESVTNSEIKNDPEALKKPSSNNPLDKFTKPMDKVEVKQREEKETVQRGFYLDSEVIKGLKVFTNVTNTKISTTVNEMLQAVLINADILDKEGYLNEEKFGALWQQIEQKEAKKKK